jgi:hypothetical protein
VRESDDEFDDRAPQCRTQSARPGLNEDVLAQCAAIAGLDSLIAAGGRGAVHLAATREGLASSAQEAISDCLVAECRRQVRVRRIIARREAGLSLAEIGAEFGLTRERVRQIIAEHDGPSRQDVARFVEERAERTRLELRDGALDLLATQPQNS